MRLYHQNRNYYLINSENNFVGPQPEQLQELMPQKKNPVMSPLPDLIFLFNYFLLWGILPD